MELGFFVLVFIARVGLDSSGPNLGFAFPDEIIRVYVSSLLYMSLGFPF